MRSVCGVLVVNHLPGLQQAPLLDDETWQSFDCWVICCGSTEAKEILRSKIASEFSGGAPDILIERERADRYQTGLASARKLADYALLLNPGTTLLKLKLPALSDHPASVRLHYVGVDNQSRWRKTLIRLDDDWIYNDAAAEWQAIKPVENELVDTKLNFREDPRHQHTQLDYSIQLQAQKQLLQEHGQSEYIIYEVAMSYLRLGDSAAALNWFELLSEVAENPVHKTIALTQRAILNRSKISTDECISLLERALSFSPSLIDSYFYLAELLFAKGQIEQAMQIANAWKNQSNNENTALDCTMVQTRIPRLLAQCHAHLGQNENAMAHYNQALHINNTYYVPSSEEDSQAAMHTERDILYQHAFPLPELTSEVNNRCKIIVAFWNAAKYLPACVKSIADQKYRHYEVIFVDDDSSDSGLNDIDLSGLAAYRIVSQPERQGPLKNQIEAVLNHCDEDDIVIVLDGDDQLADDQVLTHLNQVYAATDCWVTIGQFRVSDEWRWGYARPILPDEDIAEIFARQTLRFPVHLRTHRAGLVHRLHEQDPDLKAYCDEHGKFFFYASDVAYCRAIMSLAGANKIRYIARIMMDYNVDNPLSVHQKNREAQTRACIAIAQLEPIEPISDYTA